MFALKNVLVATDFSDPSAVALTYGREFARTFGAKLHVLHVVETVAAATAGEFYAGSIPDMQARIEDAARRQMNAIVTAEDRVDLHAQTIVLAWATPAPSIVAYAEEAEIDLIVMGTHGRGGFAHLFMGSVAERVVRLASCPVLTVRHPEREFVAADALVASARA